MITQSDPGMGTFMLGDITGMGFDARTPSGMGSIQFVTPIRTVTTACPTCEPIPGVRGAVAALRLEFAPEPGRGVLLLAGGLALLWLGRGRSRGTT